MRKENSSELPLTDVFGICRQTILPLYRRPTVDSALVTQLLFGECYQVNGITSDQNWYKVLHEDTGISGWISSKSLKNIPKTDYQSFLNQDYQVVTSPIAAIEYLGTNLYLLPGSRLHFSEIELFNWQDHIGFTGSVRSHAVRADRDQLIEIALKYINAPYLSGGRSIFGLDEKQGFDLIVTIAGYSLSSQKNPGRTIALEEILPGDLLIFRTLESNDSRYAFFLGAEEVLWMDNRMRVTNLGEWADFIKNNMAEHAVLETRSIVE